MSKPISSGCSGDVVLCCKVVQQPTSRCRYDQPCRDYEHLSNDKDGINIYCARQSHHQEVKANTTYRLQSPVRRPQKSLPGTAGSVLATLLLSSAPLLLCSPSLQALFSSSWQALQTEEAGGTSQTDHSDSDAMLGRHKKVRIGVTELHDKSVLFEAKDGVLHELEQHVAELESEGWDLR